MESLDRIRPQRHLKIPVLQPHQRSWNQLTWAMIRVLKLSSCPLTIKVEVTPQPIAAQAIQTRGGNSFEVMVAGTWHRILYESLSIGKITIIGHLHMRRRIQNWSSQIACHSCRPQGYPVVALAAVHCPSSNDRGLQRIRRFFWMTNCWTDRQTGIGGK